MSNVLGIICEYNPFHNGHLYHLNEAKRLAPKEKTQKQNLFYQVKGIFFGKKKLRKK